MGTKVGPNIVEDGLIYLIDPQSTRSYPGSGTTVYPMVAANTNNGTLNGSITYTSGANGGFNFNGPTTFDNISLTETVTHKTGQNFSYDVWVYFDALSGYDKTIVGKVGCNIGLIQAGGSLAEYYPKNAGRILKKIMVMTVDGSPPAACSRLLVSKISFF